MDLKVTHEEKRLLCYNLWKKERNDNETLDEFIKRKNYPDKMYLDALESTVFPDHEKRSIKEINKKFK